MVNLSDVSLKTTSVLDLSVTQVTTDINTEFSFI